MAAGFGPPHQSNRQRENEAMKNFIQPGNVITLTAPANVSSGDFVLVGALFGVAARDALSGDPVECRTEGVFELPKAAALAINEGDALYWDTADGNFNKTAADNTFAGHAVADAGANDATVKIRLSI